MKNTKLLLLVLFSAVTTSTQAQNFEWAVGMVGNTGFGIGESIITDYNGDVYSVGIFSDTVDFDPGVGVTNLISRGNTDIFIQKLDSAGNLLWVKQLGGYSQDIGTSITVDHDGNIYVTGIFHDTVDFDPGIGVTNLSSNGFYDFFILKLDINGGFVWVKQIGGIYGEQPSSIIHDSSDHLYIAGFFQDTVDFDPGVGMFNLISSSSGHSCFIQKLDTAGNFIWAKQMGGSNAAEISEITLDNSGNIYSIGHFYDTVDFDPGSGILNLVSESGYDIFIQKLNIHGNFLWARRIGGNGHDFGTCIIADKDGNTYISGGFRDTVDFDTGPGVLNLFSKGEEDIFIKKLDSNGNLVWVHTFGRHGTDVGNSIVFGNDGNIYIAGNFEDRIDFNPGTAINNLNSGGFTDIFMLVLDTAGQYVWAGNMGGQDYDFCNSICANNKGSVYSTGRFRRSANFDPNGVYNLTSVNSTDNIFIQKMNMNIGVATKDIIKNGNDFIIYPNPVKNTLISNLSENQIMDLNGKTIMTTKEEKIDVSHLSTGVYIIEGMENDKKYIQKFLKE